MPKYIFAVLIILAGAEEVDAPASAKIGGVVDSEPEIWMASALHKYDSFIGTQRYRVTLPE